VHVPDEVRRDRYKPAPRLAQPAGKQQQFAQRPGVIQVKRAIVPAADSVRVNEGGGVVPFEDALVLPPEVERLADAAQDGVECLLLKSSHRHGHPRQIDLSTERVEVRQQPAAVF
jgi:hypothetical protein